MASLHSDSPSFRIPFHQQPTQPQYQQSLQQQQYMVCMVTNNPKYHKPCTYNLSPRGCKFGQSCWFQHFVQQPPQQQQQHLYNPTATISQQIDLKSITTQLSLVITTLIKSFQDQLSKLITQLIQTTKLPTKTPKPNIKNRKHKHKQKTQQQYKNKHKNKSKNKQTTASARKSIPKTPQLKTTTKTIKQSIQKLTTPKLIKNEPQNEIHPIQQTQQQFQLQLQNYNNKFIHSENNLIESKYEFDSNDSNISSNTTTSTYNNYYTETDEYIEQETDTYEEIISSDDDDDELNNLNNNKNNKNDINLINHKHTQIQMDKTIHDQFISIYGHNTAFPI